MKGATEAQVFVCRQRRRALRRRSSGRRSGCCQRSRHLVHNGSHSGGGSQIFQYATSIHAVFSSERFERQLFKSGARWFGRKPVTCSTPLPTSARPSGLEPCRGSQHFKSLKRFISELRRL